MNIVISKRILTFTSNLVFRIVVIIDIVVVAFA